MTLHPSTPLRYPGNGYVTNIKYGTIHKTAVGWPGTTERGSSTKTACGKWTSDNPSNWMDGETWIGAVRCKVCRA